MPRVREKQNFLQVRELSGNFEKMSGNFGYLTNVREMSGNFVMTNNYFLKMIAFFCFLLFQALKFMLALLHSAYIPIIPFSKCFITSMSTIFYINCFLAKTFNIDRYFKSFLWINLAFNLEKFNELSGKNGEMSGKCQGILNRFKCGNPVNALK